MIICHHGLNAELPDEWWITTGMLNFVRSSAAYRCDQASVGNRRVCLIRITDIGQARRTPGVPVFNDSSEEGIPAIERVQRILRGFVQNAALPPIELSRQPGLYPFFCLINGLHRLYCSLAAGYTHIPAVKAFDLRAFDAGLEIEELC